MERGVSTSATTRRERSRRTQRRLASAMESTETRSVVSSTSLSLPFSPSSSLYFPSLSERARGREGGRTSPRAGRTGLTIQPSLLFPLHPLLLSPVLPPAFISAGKQGDGPWGRAVDKLSNQQIKRALNNWVSPLLAPSLAPPSRFHDDGR